jgi:hypothetical protein
MIVHTEGATYVLDRDSMIATRFPNNKIQLRKDAEQLKLYMWPQVTIFRPMILLMQIREDGVPTLRITMPVTAIEDQEEKEQESVRRIGRAIYDVLYIVAIRMAAEYTLRYIERQIAQRRASQRPVHH